MQLLTTLAELAAFYRVHERVSVLFFDTETTGKYQYRLPVGDRTQPRVVQLACQLVDHQDRTVGEAALLLQPVGWTIPPEASAVHGWRDADCTVYGVPAKVALATWGWLADSAGLLVAYNADFDVRLLQVEADRLGRGDPFDPSCQRVVFDPMRACADLCQIPKPAGHPTSDNDRYKWPTLAQAHEKLCGRPLARAHDAGGDVVGVRNVFNALRATLPTPPSTFHPPPSP